MAAQAAQLLGIGRSTLIPMDELCEFIARRRDAKNNF